MRPLFPILAVLVASMAFAKPIIFWSADPVGPDETMVLTGEGFDPACAVELTQLPAAGKSVTVKPLQANRRCVKAVIPASFKPGVYSARIRQGGELSEPWLVNAPDVWWLQGDEGQRGSPGGWVRVFGRCLGMGPTPQVVLQRAGSQPVVVKVTKADCWNVTASLPTTLTPGNYEVLINNGWGGTAGLCKAGAFTVIPPVAWKTDVFPVKLEGEKVDTEAAIREALNLAADNGGGIVLLPRGTYDLKGALEMPPGTILRGEGMGLVTIYIKNTTEPPTAWISGANFGVEDLSIFCFNFQRVISDTPDSERLRLSNVRIRAVPDASRHYLLKSTKETKAAIHLQGRNFRLTGCDIYARMPGFDEGRVILTGPWGFAAGKGPYYGVISDCLLRGHMYGCENLKGMIFERNRIEGVCCSATTYWNNFSQDVYVADSTIQHVYGGDREIMTFDAGGGAYFGKARAEGTKLTLAADPVFKDYAPTPHTDYRGAVVYILDGAGAGQYRFVIGNSGRDWTLDRPWTAPPDDTSIFSIVPYRGHNIFVGNTFLDGGAMQLYGSGADVIIAGNKGARIDGFFAWGLNPHGWGWQPCFNCQYLDNELVEGSGYGGRVWGPAFFGVTTGNSNEQYPGPLARATVFRRNVMQNDSQVRIDGITEDTLVERCTIRHSRIGVHVGEYAGKSAVLRQNRFEDVAQPVEGKGAGSAVVVATP